MSENQSKMYTVWTAHHGQSGSIHVVDGDVLLIINDLTRQYLHPDTADSLATVFREAARDARSQRHDGGWPAMTDEEVRAMNRTVNDLVRRVFALERAACTESEPDSEDAPMTPSEAITALCEAADELDKPALRTLAFAAQKVLLDDARHIEAVPILFRSRTRHKRVAMAWASVETHSDGAEESTCGVVEIEDGEELHSVGGLTRESQVVAASAFAACEQLVRMACTIDYDGDDQ